MQSLSEVTPCYENFYGAESVLGSWKVVHTRVHHESKAQVSIIVSVHTFHFNFVDAVLMF